MNTDIEWEKWGKKDPYFGVLSHNKFRRKNLTDQEKKEFFESGRNDIRHVLEVVRGHFDQDFFPKKALDFGCGVGRLAIPIAEIAQHVVGIDVSDSMLKEAHKNCEEHSVRNVSFLKSDDNLSSLSGSFDFILSIIVFQHIPVERGNRIFKNLLNHLGKGGICAIQITYSKASYKKSPGVASAIIRRFQGPLRALKQLLQRTLPNGNPGMQMNQYDLNELLFQMQIAGIHNFYAEYTDHAGELGVFLYFQMPKKI